MNIFENELQLIAEIERHNEFVIQCARGIISFDQFCELYNVFYCYYALDGHESDKEERILLEKHEARILPHQFIAYDILGKVCSKEDSVTSIYMEAGRFGPQEAVEKLKKIVDTYLI